MIMLVACCLPYLARKEVLVSNKAKLIHPRKQSLLCTLELKNKDASLEDDYLDYEFYNRKNKITENVGHCYVSRILSYKANVLINIGPSTDVKVTKVKLSLGWKYRLSQNEIHFKVATDDKPTTPLRPSELDLSGVDLKGKLSMSPVSQCSIPPSPAESVLTLSFSEYETPTEHDSTSYYLIHPQASVKQSSVDITSSYFNGVVEAGTPVHFKVVVKDNKGETLPKGTKYQLVVKLKDETIFSGTVHKTTFKIKRIHRGKFSPLFFINEDLIPGNHFYVNVVPSTPHSIKDLVFQVEQSLAEGFKQNLCLFHNVWMTSNANIVDRYGNKVLKSYDVEITDQESFIEFSEVGLDEGTLHFQAKANEIGKTKISVHLREEHSDANILLTTDVHCKFFPT